MFPCFGAAGYLFYLVYSQWGARFLPYSCFFISTEGDSKSEIILIKCFLYGNTHSTTLVFPTPWEYSSLPSAWSIDLMTKDKNKYLLGLKDA